MVLEQSRRSTRASLPFFHVKKGNHSNEKDDLFDVDPEQNCGLVTTHSHFELI